MLIITNIKTRFALITSFAFSGLTSCESQSLPQHAQNQPVFLNTPVAEEIAEYQGTVFPLEDSFTVPVLTVGNFHSDEVPAGADSKKWFALFKAKAGFYIAEIRIKTARIYDPVLDETEDAQTGWEVRTSNNDTAVLLVQGAGFVKEGTVLGAPLPKTHVLAGDTV